MKIFILLLILFIIITLSIILFCQSKKENIFIQFVRQPLFIESKQDYKLDIDKQDDKCSRLIIKQENLLRKQKMPINNKKRNQILDKQDIQQLYQIQQQLKKLNCVVSI